MSLIIAINIKVLFMLCFKLLNKSRFKGIKNEHK